jgi:hypothetical protein
VWLIKVPKNAKKSISKSKINSVFWAPFYIWNENEMKNIYFRPSQYTKIIIYYDQYNNRCVGTGWPQIFNSKNWGAFAHFFIPVHLPGARAAAKNSGSRTMLWFHPHLLRLRNTFPFHSRSLIFWGSVLPIWRIHKASWPSSVVLRTNGIISDLSGALGGNREREKWFPPSPHKINATDCYPAFSGWKDIPGFRLVPYKISLNFHLLSCV